MLRRKLKGEVQGLVDYAFVTFASDEEAAACVAGATS